MFSTTWISNYKTFNIITIVLYSTEEYADMHLVFGKKPCNATAAAVYEKFTNRKLPTPKSSDNNGNKIDIY